MLLEPSLRSIGGHYHEYATQILTAAEEAGMLPVLVAHRKLPRDVCFPPSWRIYREFPFIVSGIHRVPRETHPGTHRGPGSAIFAAVDHLKSTFGFLRIWKNSSRIRGFSRACRRVFTQESLRTGDIVLCATTTDTEVLGLVEFLRDFEPSLLAEWHLQFHFRVFRGRDPDFPQQQHMVTRLTQRMTRALARVPRHRIHFYGTTETLVRQLRWIALPQVELLPWPVRTYRVESEVIKGPMPQAKRLKPFPGRRLRILVAGASRGEKGASRLDFSSRLAKRTQLILQVPQRDQGARWLHRLSRKWKLQTCERVADTFLPEAQAADIVCVPHPLTTEEYQQLLGSSDIGLLPYDADEYFARCSGVLLEFFASGIPVIGSAGCWLGDQIEWENQGYYRRLAAVVDRPESGWTLALHSTPLYVGSDIAHVPISLNGRLSQDILVGLTGLESAVPGTYVRGWLELHSGIGRSSQRIVDSQLVGYAVPHHGRASGADNPGRAVIYLLLSCPAFQTPTSQSLSTKQVLPRLGFQVRGSRAEVALSVSIFTRLAPNMHLPRGWIGRTFVDQQDIVMALEEVLEHYDHYAAKARWEAAAWRQRHDPKQTILKLHQRRVKWV